MKRPLAIDLYCGRGGWTKGFLAEGYDAIGFDIEYHDYPGQQVLQDARTLHGSQFRDADVLVGSSPCQEFSYRAMPFKRCKSLPPPVLGIELFEAQFRIQREACEAAGRYIPMVVENVCGAQKWVGRARWHYGSFYLWGDVPAIMPYSSGLCKKPGVDISKGWNNDYTRNPDGSYSIWNHDGAKNNGGSWFGQRDGKLLEPNHPGKALDLRRSARMTQ